MKRFSLSEKKKHEILAFLWFSAGTVLLLSLISYTPHDIPYETSTILAPVHNYVGVTGAYLSWGLRFLFGTGSFFFVFLFAFWALAAWTHQKSQSIWLKFFSGTIFFVSACASLSLLSQDPASQFQRGGIIGYFIGHLLHDLFGNAALYMAATLFFLSVLLATEFLVLPIILSVFSNLKEILWQSLPAFKRSATNHVSQVLNEKDASEKKKIQRQKIERTNFLRINGAGDKAVNNRLGDSQKKMAPIIRTVLPMKSRTPNPKDIVSEPKLVKTPSGDFRLPPLSLLRDPVTQAQITDAEIEDQSRILEETLADFSIVAKVVEVEHGPTVTRFELQPASGVKVQRIVALADNISLAMMATSVRIIAPIPGKSRVGIEVPNSKSSMVTLKELIGSDAFREKKSKLTIAIGKDTAGHPIIADLEGMPHLLIAGSTGSGKTVCVNSVITTLLFNTTPDEVKLILIDPKMVEFTCYNGLPHLITPVVTQLDKVPSVLNWLVSEMRRRYELLSQHAARNISGYNDRLASKEGLARMPYILVFIDELADLMMSQGKEVETAVTRLSQLARAVGIHLVLATQRPSVDVITGVIKANFPARISFQVASKVDSRTVLDMNGAETLLGKGDLLFLNPSLPKPMRAQGALVTDDEIEGAVKFVRDQQKPDFDENILQAAKSKQADSHDFRSDEYFEEACRIIVTSGQASVSMLQRRLGLGYTRAARLVDMMEEDGIVGPAKGSKPREVLIDLETLSDRQKGHEKSEQTKD